MFRLGQKEGQTCGKFSGEVSCFLTDTKSQMPSDRFARYEQRANSIRQKIRQLINISSSWDQRNSFPNYEFSFVKHTKLFWKTRMLWAIRHLWSSTIFSISARKNLRQPHWVDSRQPQAFCQSSRELLWKVIQLLFNANPWKMHSTRPSSQVAFDQSRSSLSKFFRNCWFAVGIRILVHVKLNAYTKQQKHPLWHLLAARVHFIAIRISLCPVWRS